MSCPSITSSKYFENWPVRSLGAGTQQVIKMVALVPSEDHSWRIRAQCQVDLQPEVGVRMAVGPRRLSAAITAIRLMMKVSLVHKLQIDFLLVLKTIPVMKLEWVCLIHGREDR
jgi:hypothetical protein